MKKVLIILLLCNLFAHLRGQEVVSDFSEITVYQDSLWQVRTLLVTSVEGSTKNDTLLTYSSPLDSTDMAEHLASITIQENEERGAYWRDLYVYNNSGATYLDYDTLIQSISDSTLFDFTALTTQEFFTSGNWKLVDTVEVGVDFSYAGAVTMTTLDDSESWTVEVISTSEIVVKGFKGEDVRLFRTSGTSQPFFRSLGEILPFTADKYRPIQLYFNPISFTP